jgi:hypothetical protein
MAADPETAPELPETFSVEVAALSDIGQAEVYEALEAGELDAETILDNAEAADVNREDIADLRLQQADAAEAGDYEKAEEYADKVGYEMREIEELGGDMDNQIVDADRQEAALDNADWNQDIADANADTAEAYAAEGDFDHAAQYADTAIDHAEVAADYGDQGDAGGHYADHDVSTTSE